MCLGVFELTFKAQIFDVKSRIPKFNNLNIYV